MGLLLLKKTLSFHVGFSISISMSFAKSDSLNCYLPVWIHLIYFSWVIAWIIDTIWNNSYEWAYFSLLILKELQEIFNGNLLLQFKRTNVQRLFTAIKQWFPWVLPELLEQVSEQDWEGQMNWSEAGPERGALEMGLQIVCPNSNTFT